MPEKTTGCPLERHSTRLPTKQGYAEDIGNRILDSDVGNCQQTDTLETPQSRQTEERNIVNGESVSVEIYCDVIQQLLPIIIISANWKTTMAIYQNKNPHRLARRAGKQGARCTVVVLDKYATGQETDNTFAYIFLNVNNQY